MEEAFYESLALRRFAVVDLGRSAATDETTILRFRHLLEEQALGAAILVTVNRYLDARGTVNLSQGFDLRNLLTY
jgi:IS5 family transposase